MNITYLRTCHSNIKQRCLNPLNPDFRFYGAKGISICSQWKHRRYGCWRFILYILTTIGHRPDGWVLDRIDNSKGYEPGNLRWVSVLTSERNKRPRKTDPKAPCIANVAAGFVASEHAIQ